MAVLDTLPGVEVTVSAGGKQLTEYEDKAVILDGPLASKTVVRYIESTSDFNVYVDDQRIGGRISSAKDFVNGIWNGTYLGRGSTLSDGRERLQKFKFAHIKTIEDADKRRIMLDAKKFRSVGQLTIKAFRAGELGEQQGAAAQTSSDPAAVEIAEKALNGKGVSHAASFVASIPYRHRIFKPAYLDGKDKPISIYQFRYLSKEALRAQLIVPRTPSPDPYDALTAAERERLGRERLAELKAAEVKAEGQRKRKIKEEDRGSAAIVSSHPYKKVKLPDGREAIDLTD